MMMTDRSLVSVGFDSVPDGRVTGRRLLRSPVIVIAVLVVNMIDHRRVGVVDAGKVETVFKAVPAVHRSMRLQRDHDDRGEADSQEARQFRQGAFPPTALDHVRPRRNAVRARAGARVHTCVPFPAAGRTDASNRAVSAATNDEAIRATSGSTLARTVR